MYCLARDCADDGIVRKFVAPALELIMLDKALNDSNESNRESQAPLRRDVCNCSGGRRHGGAGYG